MSEDRKRSYDDESQQYPRKERRTGKVIKILCPYYCTGAVIGTKGAAIDQIKTESGTNIQVSKGAARFPKTDERVVAISGDLDGQMHVINFVQTKIRVEQPSAQAKGVKMDRVEARRSLCKLVVSDTSIGKLIGKGGANVNKLKDDHDVKINMMKAGEATPGLNERIVSIEGDDKNVDSCIAEIVKDVFEDERADMDYNLDYNNFQPNRGYGGDKGYNNNNNGGYNNHGGYQDSSYGTNYGNYGYGSDSYGSQGGYGQGGYQGGYGGYNNQGYGAGYSQGYGGYGGSQGYANSGGYGSQGYGPQAPQGAYGSYGGNNKKSGSREGSYTDKSNTYYSENY